MKEPAVDTPQHVTEAEASISATVRGLTELEAWVKSHPELRGSIYEGTTWTVYRSSSVSVADTVRAISDGAPIGAVQKRESAAAETLLIERTFSGAVKLWFHTDRSEVCERVVVGTETVEVPDPEALAAVPTVTVEREIVEWKCAPILGGDREPEVAA